jgi:hypothetical protein
MSDATRSTGSSIWGYVPASHRYSPSSEMRLGVERKPARHVATNRLPAGAGGSVQVDLTRSSGSIKDGGLGRIGGVGCHHAAGSRPRGGHIPGNATGGSPGGAANESKLPRPWAILSRGTPDEARTTDASGRSPVRKSCSIAGSHDTPSYPLRPTLLALDPLRIPIATSDANSSARPREELDPPSVTLPCLEDLGKNEKKRKREDEPYYSIEIEHLTKYV